MLAQSPDARSLDNELIDTCIIADGYPFQPVHIGAGVVETRIQGNRREIPGFFTGLDIPEEVVSVGVGQEVHFSTEFLFKVGF